MGSHVKILKAKVSFQYLKRKKEKKGSHDNEGINMPSHFA